MSKELISKAKLGDADALNTLINTHRDLAYSIALKLLKNKDDAEDVTQNSFIIVLNNIKRFKNESKFSTWLYKIVYHECLGVLKDKNKTRSSISIDTYEQPDDNEEAISTDLDKLLASLKPKEYTIITLFYLKEKSIKEICKITALSKANIKVILHRARHKMKAIALISE